MDEPRKAHSLLVSQCGCGCGEFHLELCDEAGDVFAVAIVPSGAAIRIAEQITDAIIGDEDDEIGEVMGHA
jgi:hypothetical protein